MEWTITTEIVGKGDRDASVKVTATKGDTNLERTFTGITSREGLKAAVKNWLANYENLKTVEAGTLDLTEPEPTPEPEKTAAELAKEAWVEDVADLQKAIKMQELGAPILSAAQLTALQNRVRTNWKQDYKDVTPS